MTTLTATSLLTSCEKNVAVNISTSHISFGEHTELEAKMLHKPHHRIIHTQHGLIFIVYSDLEVVESEFKGIVGPGIYSLLLWAHSNGVRFLELDCDAVVVDSLPVYEW